MSITDIQDKSDSGKTIKDIINDITNVKSECHFAVGEKPVCSPNEIVDKMKSFAKKKGIQIEHSPPVHIVKQVKDLLDCNSESCIIKHPDFISFAKITHIEDVLNKFFKPDGPATHFGLLSNYNIDDVLTQLTNKFTNRRFLHIPYQMRDFEKVGTALATIDLAKEFEKHDTFGVVLNTDYASGNGIHWYALYGEKNGNDISLEYFNSSGKEPLMETQAWLNKTKHYLEKKLGAKVKIKYSTGIQYQDDDHSCGVYSCMYIYMRLAGINASDITTENMNDELMHNARRFLFRIQV